MSAVRKISLAAGEISPEFWGRVDQVRHATGAAVMRNMLVMKSGGAQNRPGTQYQGTVFSTTGTTVIHRWAFSAAQTYMLEFSDLKLAFWRNGSPILEAAKTITAATKESPVKLTSTSHGFSVGDKVYVSGIVGMTELNNRYWIVRTVPTADTFTLSYSGDGTAQGTAVDSSAFTAYTSGGIAERVYTITTPYVAADLDSMILKQSADVMVITCAGYAPRKLTRTAHTSWTLAVPTYGPSTTCPTGGSGSGTGNNATIRYMVCAKDERTGISSLSGTAHVKTVNAITKASPGVCTTSANHGYATGDEVAFVVAGTMTELSNRRFKIEVLSTTTFSLVGEDTTSYTTFSGTCSVYLTHINVTADTPTVAAPITVVTNAAATANVRYDVFKEQGGIFGFIGSTYGLTFSDTGITPDTLGSVPIYREPFQGSSNYPSWCAFYQERLVMGGSDNLPNGGDASVTRDIFNFTIHSPSEDNDAVRFQTAGYYDRIRHVASLDKMVVLTAGAEWVIAGGGEGGTLTPTEINGKAKTYNGIGALPPLTIDSNVLFFQERGQIIQDFNYSVQKDYNCEERSTWSAHLFDGHTVVSWDYQRTPGAVVWMARDDGELISLTYRPDQEMGGFAHHDLYGGSVESIAVISEGEDDEAEDVVYMVVARELQDGTTTRYIERLASRRYTDVLNAKFLDSCLEYDGTGSGTVTLSGSGWTNATSLTCTFSIAQTNATVGNEVQINGVDADGADFQIRARIVGVTSTTVVTVIPHTTVPTPMRAVVISDWKMAVDTFVGLWHLEGQTVSVFGDRVVVASALNPQYETQYTVTDGAITLIGEQRLGQAVVGLPVTADLSTLDIDPPEDGRFAARTKLISSVAVRVAESRSFWIGTNAPDDDDEDPIQGLYEPKIRQDETYDDPMALTTGIVKVRTRSRMNRRGRVFIRVMEPTPVSVIEIVESGAIFEG